MGLREDLYFAITGLYKESNGVGDPSTFAQRVEDSYRKTGLDTTSSPKYNSEEAMTEAIQKVAPNYKVVNREKMQQQGANKDRFFKRVLDTECDVAIDPVARAMKEREPNSRVITAYAAYARAAMPEETKELMDSITELYNTKPRPDDYFDKLAPLSSKLQEMIHKDIAKNAVSFEKELSKEITDEELYNNWPVWRAKIALCSSIEEFQNEIPEEGYDGMSRKQIRSACDNIMSIDMVINNRMSFLASDCAGLVDFDEAVKVEGNKLVTVVESDTPCTQLAGLGKIGAMMTMARQNLGKNVSLKQNLTGSPNFLVQTMDGQVFDLGDEKAHEYMLVKREPVFMLSKENPDSEPSLVIPTNGFGGNLIDENVKNADPGQPPMAPEEPAPVPEMPINTASGIAKFWDRICKAIGLESLRPQSCKQYEADKAEYDASVAEHEKYNKDLQAYNDSMTSYQQRRDVIENTQNYLSPEVKNQVRENIIQKQFGKSAAEYSKELKEAAAEQARRDAIRAEAHRKDEEKRSFDRELSSIKSDFRTEMNKSGTTLNKSLLERTMILSANSRKELLDVDLSDPKAAADALGTAMAIHVLDNACRTSLKDGKYDSVMEKIEELNKDGAGMQMFFDELKKIDLTEIASKMSPEDLKTACNPHRDLKSGVLLNKIFAEAYAPAASKEGQAPQLDLSKNMGGQEKGKDVQELKVPSNQEAPKLG